MSHFLEVAKQAAKTAGLYAKEKQHSLLSISKKENNTLVTDVDIESERIILDIILKEFPDHAYFSEEKGQSIGSSEYCWYIDPIDGTQNFIRGLPLYGVCIALAKGDEIIAGVTYLPFFDELYYASKGEGAWCNGEKISVSDRSLADSSLELGHGDIVAEKPFVLSLTNKMRDYRFFYCTAFTLAQIARGRFDSYVYSHIHLWDIASGIILIQEAGGKVTHFTGENLKIKDKTTDIIASNPLIHDALINEVQKE